MTGRGVILGFSLALAVACGDGASAAKSASGSQRFVSSCGLCHGMEGAGTQLGPTLQGKKKFWTKEKLVQYLKDPAPYTGKDPRLAEQAKKYSIPMSRFDMLPADELNQIAEFVLGLP